MKETKKNPRQREKEAKKKTVPDARKKIKEFVIIWVDYAASNAFPATHQVTVSCERFRINLNSDFDLAENGDAGNLNSSH